MFVQGLYYSRNDKTEKYRMKEYIDLENRRPTRAYLVKLLIDYGADPNHQSEEFKHTPLHWLCYWGDHRAARTLLCLNRDDF